MSDFATLSSKFQISIPKAVREAHEWSAGQKFAFVSKGSGVLLVPIPARDQLAGSLPEADPSDFRERSDRF